MAWIGIYSRSLKLLTVTLITAVTLGYELAKMISNDGSSIVDKHIKRVESEALPEESIPEPKRTVKPYESEWGDKENDDYNNYDINTSDENENDTQRGGCHDW